MIESGEGHDGLPRQYEEEDDDTLYFADPDRDPALPGL